MKVSHKIIISYIGIILITSLLWMYFKKKNQIREGAKGLDIMKPLKKEATKVANQIKKSPPVKAALNFVKNIQLSFKSAMKANKDLNNALTFLFTQGGNDFADIGKKTVNVAGKTFTNLWVSTDSVIKCIEKLWKNKTFCFAIYGIHGLLYILYCIGIGLPCYICDLFSGNIFNIQRNVDITIDNILNVEPLKYVIDYFGFPIHRDCYNCKITPMPKISANPIKISAQKMNHDFKHEIPNKFVKVGKDFSEIGSYLKKAFTGK